MNLDTQKILSRFKVYESPQLFDTDDFFTLLKQNRCPICSCKLYLRKDGKMYYCKSVKHKSRFVISTEKLDKFKS